MDMSRQRAGAESIDLIMPRAPKEASSQGVAQRNARDIRGGAAPGKFKTSISLDADLVEPLAIAAARERMRKGDIVNEAIRAWLAERGFID